MTIPALPGCEADYKTVEEAHDKAPEFVQNFVDDLVRQGKPVPTEPPRTVQMLLQVEVPSGE